VRVATFNVFSGRSADGAYDERRFADAVASLDADLIGLQEVDVSQPRSAGADLTAVAAQAAGAVAHRFSAALAGTPQGWVAATGSEPEGAPGYGIAFLSRFAVRSWLALPVAPAPVRLPHRRDRRLAWVRDEPRTAILAQVETPQGLLDVVTTHLSFLRPWNGWQLRRLLADLPPSPHPRILIGDLNMGPRSARAITRMAPLAVGPTFPAHRPRVQIDHILGSPGIRVASGRAVALPMSDHRALVSVLDLTPGMPAGE
jgi:endonuclease/exonuclease/phosphatase family metal-dependent hydrolase